ncbi:MAG TPA: hypothetical protein VL991_12295 [Terracidiphilus sp.]|jgi:hypothetical protein|nr:hypothetical protein [Terracidiphilus sp.]
MRSMYRSFILAPAMMACAAFTANTAMAESIRVPFNFVAAGQNCPAGVYSLNVAGDAVSLMGRGASSFMWLMHPGNPASPQGRVVLKFDQIGNERILHSVQYGSQETSQLDKKLKPNDNTAEQSGQGQ